MILILAMMIIAAVLATAAIFANLIIREIQQSRLIDQSIQAYYLAESGVERALYQTRKREAVKPDECNLIDPSHPFSTCLEDQGFCADIPVSCITKSQGSLAGEIRENWQVEVTNEPETVIKLAEGDSFQIDLFSPFEVQNANINKIIIEELDSFDKFSQQPGKNDLKLYGELTNLSNVLQIACNEQSSVCKDFISLTRQGNYIVSISSLNECDILPQCSYIFRISHPLKSTVNWADLKIRVLSEDELISIPSRLIIESSGVYGKSLQKVTVRTPRRPPTSGLYDFVLFSEKEIIKE